VIAPGDTALLKVVLKTDGFKSGAFKKSLLLKTSDPRSPDIVLFVMGTIP
jgi:hypothetical protein